MRPDGRAPGLIVGDGVRVGEGVSFGGYVVVHAGTIIGWPMPEARAFLRDLNEEATRPENVYVHKWRQHDLVMWDNRQTMHRVRRFDETLVRDMRRTTVAGDSPTAEQAAA